MIFGTVNVISAVLNAYVYMQSGNAVNGVFAVVCSMAALYLFAVDYD